MATPSGPGVSSYSVSRPCAAPFDKSRLTQRCEMLCDRLARDRQLGGELGRRCGLALGERLEHVAAVGIGERIEDAPRRVGHAYE